MPAINKARCVRNLIKSAEKNTQLLCVDINWGGVMKGCRRWRGYILVTQRNPDRPAYCSLPKHCRISERSEQNFSKLRHTVCDSFIGRSAV